MDYKEYHNRVLACWIGKSIGGIIGAPYECHHRFEEHPGELWPKKLWPNDDLDIQVVYLEALQERGVFIDSDYLADYWHRHCFYTCCEYGVMIDNLEHGLQPPQTGVWDNRFYQEGMGCPIRSELWGLICPGNPRLAAEYAAMDGCLDHADYSIDAEKFLSAAAALAFFNSDLTSVLEQALDVLEPASEIRMVCQTVRNWCDEMQDARRVWNAIIRRWGHRNATAARTNIPLALAALFLGKGDFRETMRLCVQFGWDADCTAATTGALLGLLHGPDVLPEEWRAKMGKTLVCACQIPHQYATFETLAEDTCRLGVEMAALRNPQLELVGAPTVSLRPAPAPKVRMTVSFPEEPVLRQFASTPAMLTIENPFSERLAGTLRINAPADALCQYSSEVSLPPNGKTEVPLLLGRETSAGPWMPDKNLFHAELRLPARQPVQCSFGVFGAREFHLYGPYWDMWDKEKYQNCPYAGENACNPANISGCRDAMDTYVKLDKEYLDETALLLRELPGEDPLLLEKGGREFHKKDFGGFTGTCCYYLTLDFRASQELDDVILGFSSATPAKIWLDGRLVFSQAEHCCPIAVFGPEMRFRLTGKPQRLVVKIVSHIEEPFCELFFFKPSEDPTHAVSPYVADIATRI
ncbi:MAG: ADP-ribosylglycohydrolase family protein [Victivallales bacterium]|nr:ADP-ribosylglycohydrolase family protein [Victivallales bacterium]